MKNLYSMIDAQRIAESKNGRCLSIEYKNVASPLTWRCKSDHQWEASLRSILKGYWCRKCADINNRKHSIDEMKKIANERNGECLSESYVSTNVKLRWKCNVCGNIWDALPKGILKGQWCKLCSYKIKNSKLRGRSSKKGEKTNIESIRLILDKIGYKCLTNEYINSYTKMDFVCNNGHAFRKSYDDFKKMNYKCSDCTQYTGETITRYLFDKMFNEKFLKSRPEWLLGLKQRKLELNGYNEKLGIAFEYQGKQHYQTTPFFKGYDPRENDKIKKELCDKNGVLLICIPYNIPFENLQCFISDEFEKRNIKVDKTPIDYNLAFHLPRESRLSMIQNIARSKGGECLSSVYINMNTPMEFRCKNGHIWKTRPDHIIEGNWCRICSAMKCKNKNTKGRVT